jgi:hypothetical protein
MGNEAVMGNLEEMGNLEAEMGNLNATMGQTDPNPNPNQTTYQKSPSRRFRSQTLAGLLVTCNATSRLVHPIQHSVDQAYLYCN